MTSGREETSRNGDPLYIDSLEQYAANARAFFDADLFLLMRKRTYGTPWKIERCFKRVSDADRAFEKIRTSEKFDHGVLGLVGPDNKMRSVVGR